MKMRTILIVAAVAAIIVPLAALCLAAFATPPVYSETFVGELDEKYERLTSIKEPKIVLVGGSSLVFGVDSGMIERYVGMPVVNFGLYAALGTKIMMDLSLANIREGDIVVLAPEMDPQTLSLYFSAETAFRAADDRPSMLLHVGKDNYGALLGSLWQFSAEKLGYLLRGERPHGTGVYASEYFNAYGDLDYPREENIMGLYYDPNTIIRLTPATVSDAFADYVNDYVRKCRSRGATVVFGYCPMNRSALAEDTTVESVAAFEDYLARRLDCPVLGSVFDHVFDAGYFYDSNFHLNDAGVTAHTVALTKELLLLRGTPVFIAETAPEAPALPGIGYRYNGPADPNAAYFTSELTDFGVRLTGLTEAGKAQKELTIPVAADGNRVVLLGAGFLKDGGAEKIVIPQGFEQFVNDTQSSMLTIENDAFADSGVREIWIYDRWEATIMPPATFIGATVDFVIHVPAGSEYNSGYFWSERYHYGKKLTFVTDIILPDTVAAASVAGKIYRYEKDGFGGPFDISFAAGGSVMYYEGSLSSIIGSGTWKQEGDDLTITDGTRTYRFTVSGDAIVFRKDTSSRFVFVDVADGDRFVEYKGKTTIPIQ